MFIDYTDVIVLWMQLRVELSGKDTQRAFDSVVRSLAKNAPPVPGFRKAKGGKLSYDIP